MTKQTSWVSFEELRQKVVIIVAQGWQWYPQDRDMTRWERLEPLKDTGSGCVWAKNGVCIEQMRLIIVYV